VHPVQSQVKSIDRIKEAAAAAAAANQLSGGSGFATVSVSLDPDGADIYVDGAFVGSAPAKLKLAAGKHLVRISFAEYNDWSREMTTLGGSEVHLTGNLEKAQK
jgi:PEGA domain-containing protein